MWAASGGRLPREDGTGDAYFSTQSLFLFLDVSRDARMMYCSLLGGVAGWLSGQIVIGFGGPKKMV